MKFGYGLTNDNGPTYYINIVSVRTAIEVVRI